MTKRLNIIVGLAFTLLLIPLVAMQFSEEVNWTLSDFMMAGVLLLSTGFICELLLRRVKKTKHRVVACFIVFVLLFLTWAELAVGIFGTPLAGS